MRAAAIARALGTAAVQSPRVRRAAGLLVAVIFLWYLELRREWWREPSVALLRPSFEGDDGLAAVGDACGWRDVPRGGCWRALPASCAALNLTRAPLPHARGAAIDALAAALRDGALPRVRDVDAQRVARAARKARRARRRARV